MELRSVRDFPEGGVRRILSRHFYHHVTSFFASSHGIERNCAKAKWGMDPLIPVLHEAFACKAMPMKTGGEF